MMKEVKLFMFEGCPHCKKAGEMIAALFTEHPEYAEIPLTVIDERKHPEIAEKYDYYYVPTLFTGGVKMMEGAPTKQAIEKAFAAALERGQNWRQENGVKPKRTASSRPA